MNYLITMPDDTIVSASGGENMKCAWVIREDGSWKLYRFFHSEEDARKVHPTYNKGERTFTYTERDKKIVSVDVFE